MVDVKVARVKEMYAAKQKRRKLYPGGGGGGMVTEDGRVEVLGCVDEASGRRHWGDTIVLRRQPRIRRVMGIPGMCVTQQVLEENQIVDRKVPRECQGTLLGAGSHRGARAGSGCTAPWRVSMHGRAHAHVRRASPQCKVSGFAPGASRSFGASIGPLGSQRVDLGRRWPKTFLLVQ